VERTVQFLENHAQRVSKSMRSRRRAFGTDQGTGKQYQGPGIDRTSDIGGHRQRKGAKKKLGKQTNQGGGLGVTEEVVGARTSGQGRKRNRGKETKHFLRGARSKRIQKLKHRAMAKKERATRRRDVPSGLGAYYLGAPARRGEMTTMATSKKEIKKECKRPHGSSITRKQKRPLRAFRSLAKNLQRRGLNERDNCELKRLKPDQTIGSGEKTKKERVWCKTRVGDHDRTLSGFCHSVLKKGTETTTQSSAKMTDRITTREKNCIASTAHKTYRSGGRAT